MTDMRRNARALGKDRSDKSLWHARGLAGDIRIGRIRVCRQDR
ncbi:MAG: hypothetical protein ACJ8DZ_09050 [Allosphingosinicella sp.]